MPQDVHRALYLDGDVICTGGLEELFNIDLKGYPAAMCIERGTSQIYTYNRLGYPPQDGYFNSGVILFDLDLWRKENISRAMFSFLTANLKKRLFLDQDVINACLHGKIFQLDFAYNVDPACFNVFYWLKEEKSNYYAQTTQYLPKSEWPALRAGVENPRLVHFWGIKPWYKEADNPFTPVWRYFYAQSPWANERLEYRNLPLKARIKRLGRKTLERLNLIAPVNPPYPEEVYKIAQGVLDRLIEEDTRLR